MMGWDLEVNNRTLKKVARVYQTCRVSPNRSPDRLSQYHILPLSETMSSFQGPFASEDYDGERDA